jgi:hypothetical protein
MLERVLAYERAALETAELALEGAEEEASELACLAGDHEESRDCALARVSSGLLLITRPPR